MKKRDLLFSFLTSFVLFATIIFVSCASQQRVQGEDEEALLDEETEVQEPDLAERSEETPEGLVEEKVGEEKTEKQEVTQAAAPGEELKDDLANLETPGEGDAKDVAKLEEPSQKEPPPEAPSESVEELEKAGPSEAPVIPSDAEKSITEQSATEQPGSEILLTEPVTDSLPKIADAPRVSSAGSSSAPEIPGEAVERGGVSLNRFVFARKGDTPKSVAQIIYESPTKAKDLVRWNAGQWKAGKVIYYVSPTQPGDTQMRSFYQERGVSPQAYVVSRGDWLSRIAMKKYGDARSWKEVAVVNGIEDPDKISPGQKLALYPQDLSGYSGQTIAQSEPPPVATSEPTQQVSPDVSAQVPPQTQLETQPEPTPGQLTPEPPPLPPTPPIGQSKTPKFPPFGNLDIAKLIEQNMLAIAFGGLMLILLLAYAALKKKKRRSFGADFTDDAAVPKMKRK